MGIRINKFQHSRQFLAPPAAAYVLGCEWLMETAVSVCCLAMSNSTETHSQYMHPAQVQHTYHSLLFEDLFYFKCMGNFLIISWAFVSHKPNSRNARNPFPPIVRRIIYIYQLSSEEGCRLNPRVHSFDMADDISTTPHQLSNLCHTLMPCSKKKMAYRAQLPSKDVTSPNRIHYLQRIKVDSKQCLNKRMIKRTYQSF